MYRSSDNKGNLKYLSRSKAVVTHNSDPKFLGRIRVYSPVVGQTEWIPYLRQPGTFDIPRIDDIVFIEAELGDIDSIIAWGNINIDTGSSGVQSLERTDGSRNDKPDPGNTSDAFYYFSQTDTKPRFVPTNRGLFSPSGHLIEMDDGISKFDNTWPSPPTDINNTNVDKVEKLTTQSKGIRLTTSNGRKVHLLEDEDNDNIKILISDAKGNKIEIDEVNDILSIKVDGAFDVNVTGLKQEIVTSDYNEIVGIKRITSNIGNIELDSELKIRAIANGDIDLESRSAGTIEFKTSTNTYPGNVVTDNVANNDPITGIPLNGNPGTKISG